MVDLPPELEVLGGVGVVGLVGDVGPGLGVEASVPRLGNSDEVDDLDGFAVPADQERKRP